MRRITVGLIGLLLALAACNLIGNIPAVRPTAAGPSPTAGALLTTPAATRPPETPAASAQAPTATAGKPTPTPLATFIPTNPGAPEVGDYTITVRLAPETHQLTGEETITYHNTTARAIPDLVFHLYLNAFKDETTIFMKESGGQLRGDAFNPQNNGWIEVSDLTVQDGPALKLVPQADGTLAKAELPQPVAPGQSVTVRLNFKAQLPQAFARTGWALDDAGDPFFLVGQWFPKLGVWTAAGWNAYPFHGNSEFFSDFGSYAVTITVPENYVVGASGVPTAVGPQTGGTRTITYGAKGVIDFAWVASPNLQVAARRIGDVDIQYLYLPEHRWSVDRTLDAAADAVKTFGEWYFPYPYARLSVVDVPDLGSGAGGMEYPTFVTVGAGPRNGSGSTNLWTDGVAITTIHEIAHQWFQSMVATNEAEEPWLDEGFADYSTARLLIARAGLPDAALDQGDFPQGLLAGRRQRFLDQPDIAMDHKAWDYQGWDEYVAAAYAKPDMALLTLERVLGTPVMDEILRTYTTTYRFGHPTTADFQRVAVKAAGQPLDWFFTGLVDGGETLNYIARGIDGKTITVERQGALEIPTDIEVTFTDGTRQTITYNGLEALGKIQVNYPAAVKAFTIDPDHKLLVELDWEDNTLQK